MTLSLQHHILYSTGGNGFVTANDKQNNEHPGTLSLQYLTTETYPFFETRPCLLLPLRQSQET